MASAAELPAAIPNVYVHVPPVITADAPVQVVIALHGMGGSGNDFGAPLAKLADQNGWLLVAPTINYGDWTDPNQVASEEPRLIAWLSDYIDQLGVGTGMTVKSRVLLIGHSRGAQLAHRFALFEPEKVLGVAALSAGTYTLPFTQDAGGRSLAFPYGVSNLEAVAGHAFERDEVVHDTAFWVGVGSEDNNPADLPRAWDALLGPTRVSRATAFDRALHTVGAHSTLVTFRGQRHGLTPDMSAAACEFLRNIDLAPSTAQ
ncbi:MAG: hypothetical protein NVSMB2_22290 [Chloroflexota bacterium]